MCEINDFVKYVNYASNTLFAYLSWTFSHELHRSSIPVVISISLSLPFSSFHFPLQ